MARRTDVKGDTAFWTAGIVVVIFTGREQLNVQKKKKVNDDQNEKKKKKLCTWWKCRKHCVVVVFIFPLRKASKNSWVFIVLIWLVQHGENVMFKVGLSKIMPLCFYFHIFFFFTYNFFGVVFQAASKKKYKKDKTSLTKREEYLVKPNTGKSLFQDNTKWCGLITT